MDCSTRSRRVRTVPALSCVGKYPGDLRVNLSTGARLRSREFPIINFAGGALNPCRLRDFLRNGGTEAGNEHAMGYNPTMGLRIAMVVWKVLSYSVACCSPTTVTAVE